MRIADEQSNRLSFTNLVELHVLSVLRGKKMRVENIREALRFIHSKMGTEHPLADVDTKTDAVDPMVQRYLKRIDRDERGLALRLFPSTRDGEELGPRMVVIDPARHFGRPLIAGTNVETSAVAERFKAGESALELADDFGLDPSAVEEAVRFETKLRQAA